MTATYDPADEQLEQSFEELNAWDQDEGADGQALSHRTVSYGSSHDQVIDVWTPDHALQTSPW